MKNWLIIAVIWFLALPLLAQAPLGFNYQGIARQADGTPISEQDIGIRVSIIDGPQGAIQFTEEHFLTTNNFGLFTAVVGQGNGNSTLNSVDWSLGNLWLQIELDPDNSGSYIMMGSQQLMSVPYALFAQQSGEGLAAGSGIAINKGKISNVLPDRPITLTGSGNVQVSGSYPNFIIESNGSADADVDPTNEIQTISKTGNEVTLSNAGGSFTDAVDDADADATNEIQDLQLTGNILTVTKNGTATTIDLSSYLDNTDTQLTEAEVDGFVANDGYLKVEGDGSVSNEIQDLQLGSNELTITNNGSATTIDLSPYLDNTDTQLTEAEVDAFVANEGYLKMEVDGDVSNELQTISKTGSTVTLSNAGGSFTDAVDDADNNATNEIQNLADVLTINNSAGNSKIIDLADPTLAQDATTKTYVDTQDTGLQGSINTEVTNRTNADTGIQSELDATQSGSGLGTDGSYTADASTNYLTATTDLKDADKKLDTQIALNEANIATNSTDIGTLSTTLSTTYAFGGNFTITEAGAIADKTVALVDIYDDFNVLSNMEFIAPIDGVYIFLVEAELTNLEVAFLDLSIKVNTDAKRPVIYLSIYGIRRYQKSIMVNLLKDDIVKMTVSTVAAMSNTMTGTFSGYKL